MSHSNDRFPVEQTVGDGIWKGGQHAPCYLSGSCARVVGPAACTLLWVDEDDRSVRGRASHQASSRGHPLPTTQCWQPLGPLELRRAGFYIQLHVWPSPDTGTRLRWMWTCTPLLCRRRTAPGAPVRYFSDEVAGWKLLHSATYLGTR